MKRIIAAMALGAALLTSGCTSFEQSTFQTLSASKAVLDTAQQDYENRTIPKTACAQSIINNGKAAQTVAVAALQDYANVVAAKGNVSAQQAVVVAGLASLAPLVVQVQSLISNPSAACSNSSAVMKLDGSMVIPGGAQ
jgi:hypothetical protein